MWCIMIITEPKGDIKIVMAEQFRNLAMLSWYFTFSPLLLLSPQTSQIGPCGGGKKMVLVKHCNALRNALCICICLLLWFFLLLGQVNLLQLLPFSNLFQQSRPRAEETSWTTGLKLLIICFWLCVDHAYLQCRFCILHTTNYYLLLQDYLTLHQRA